MFLKYLIHVLFPVITGGLIYIGFREPQLLLFNWINILGLGQIAGEIRVYMINNVNIFPNQLIYSMPGALWLYSFISFNFLLWINSKSKARIFWIIVPIFIAFHHELFQKFNLISGTYSNTDILYYLSSILFAYFTLIRRGWDDKKEYC